MFTLTIKLQRLGINDGREYVREFSVVVVDKQLIASIRMLDG